MFVAAHNPTDQAVVVDDAGRTLGGGEWGVVDTTADQVKTAVDAARLTLAPDLKADSGNTADANDAARTAETAEKRRRQLDALDADAVHALADQAGVGEGTKAAQVGELARRDDIDVPARRGRASSEKEHA